MDINQIESLIGSEIGLSDWVEVTQKNISAFAEISLDHNFIHINPEKAAQTDLGGTVAHGLYSLSLLPHFLESVSIFQFRDNQMLLNYGFDKVRFLKPVSMGAKLRGRTRLLSVMEKAPNRVLVNTEITVEIEGEEKPALIAEWLTMTILNA